eukprot:m.167268 g.167268  ORF g.167268 m.167268 type:complete len:62 (+) comp16451_c2_seq2:702-887(+)
MEAYARGVDNLQLFFIQDFEMYKQRLMWDVEFLTKTTKLGEALETLFFGAINTNSTQVGAG